MDAIEAGPNIAVQLAMKKTQKLVILHNEISQDWRLELYKGGNQVEQWCVTEASLSYTTCGVWVACKVRLPWSIALPNNSLMQLVTRILSTLVSL